LLLLLNVFPFLCAAVLIWLNWLFWKIYCYYNFLIRVWLNALVASYNIYSLVFFIFLFTYSAILSISVLHVTCLLLVFPFLHTAHLYPVYGDAFFYNIIIFPGFLLNFLIFFSNFQLRIPNLILIEDIPLYILYNCKNMYIICRHNTTNNSQFYIQRLFIKL
jgi:hypothetical protein